MAGPGASLIGRSAVFAGCVRDCERHLPGVLANFEALSGLFDRSAFVLIENDSRDRTKSMLQDWGRGRAGFHLETLDGLGGRFLARTLRLAEARNRYLEIVRDSELRTFDYLFVLDCDDVCEMPLDLGEVTRAIAFLDAEQARAGVFANQHGYYYDLWALRHPTLCPGDIWFDILDYAETHGVSDEVAYARVFRPRLFSLPPGAGPVEAKSCFGGLGIYKLPAALDAAYCGAAKAHIQPRRGPAQALTIQACEHVALHHTIVTNGGRLFILPDLINGTKQHMNYPPSDCRTIVIDTMAADDSGEEIARPFPGQFVLPRGKAESLER